MKPLWVVQQDIYQEAIIRGLVRKKKSRKHVRENKNQDSGEDLHTRSGAGLFTTVRRQTRPTCPSAGRMEKQNVVHLNIIQLLKGSEF